MEPDSIERQNVASSVISLLRTLEKIEVTEERLEHNSKTGKLNDGTIVKY